MPEYYFDINIAADIVGRGIAYALGLWARYRIIALFAFAIALILLGLALEAWINVWRRKQGWPDIGESVLTTQGGVGERNSSSAYYRLRNRFRR